MKHSYINILICFLFAIVISCTSNSKRAANLISQSNSSEKTIEPKKSNAGNKPKASIKKSDVFKIASWNIRDLGKTKDAQELIQIAKIIRD